MSALRGGCPSRYCGHSKAQIRVLLAVVEIIVAYRRLGHCGCGAKYGCVEIGNQWWSRRRDKSKVGNIIRAFV
jgi:hypothetical protein